MTIDVDNRWKVLAAGLSTAAFIDINTAIGTLTVAVNPDKAGLRSAKRTPLLCLLLRLVRLFIFGLMHVLSVNRLYVIRITEK